MFIGTNCACIRMLAKLLEGVGRSPPKKGLKPTYFEIDHRQRESSGDVGVDDAYLSAEVPRHTKRQFDVKPGVAAFWEYTAPKSTRDTHERNRLYWPGSHGRQHGA